MLRSLRAYPALIRAYISLSFEYRSRILIWILSGVLPIIMLFVWLSLAEDGPVGGLNANDFISYYLLVIFVRRQVGVWLIWDLDRDIRLGTLSPQLLRPLDPVHVIMARSAIANRPVQFIFVAPPVIIAAILLDAQYVLTPANVLLALLAMAAAILIEFFGQMLIGCLAFWITQAIAIAEVWFYLRTFLSGWVIPLALFPAGLQAALLYLPFRYMLSLPVEILLGNLTLAEIWGGLAIAFGWVFAFFSLYRLLWSRGLKQYGAVGA